MSYDAVTLLLAPAAAACYDAGAVPTFQNETKTAHVFYSEIAGVPCFAWEGTTDTLEWLIDFAALEVPDFEHPAFGLVHAGFLATVRSVMPDIQAKLRILGNPPFYNCGHSKGGAETILFHAEMKAAGYAPLATRAFEPPRVGTRVLANYIAADDFAWTQTYNAEGSDVVTCVPYGLTWSHVGSPIRLKVSDAADIATKHRMPSVVKALGL